MMETTAAFGCAETDPDLDFDGGVDDDDAALEEEDVG
jgi:hypothetical protein